MQDPHAAEHQHRQRLAVPSRSDSLLRSMTEVVGGPLGRRTAPGLTNPGFFSVERVLLLMTMVCAFIAILAKDHCRRAGWTTPDQYSTVCFSEFPNTFVTSGLSGAFPYFSPGASFPYPPLAGMIAGATAWLTAVAGDGAARELAFFDLNAALITVVWLATVVLVARSAGRRPWDAALVAASPLLILSAFVSWDLWAAGLVSLGLYFFARRRTLWAGFAIGLAATVAPYALLILLVLLLLGIRSGHVTKMLELVAAGIIGMLLVLAPAMLRNAQAVQGYLSAQLSGTASESSIYGGYNLIATRMQLPVMSPNAINLVAAFLLLLVLVLLWWLALYTPRQPRVAALAFVAVTGFVVVNKFTEPWHAIWLLPLLALALPRWRAALLWQAAVMVNFIALMLFRSKVLGSLNDQHAIDAPYFVLSAVLAGLASCVMAGLVIRDMWQPEHDVVRRGGVHDPQGGVLLTTREASTHG